MRFKVNFTRDRRSIGLRIGRWWLRLAAYRMDDYDAMLTGLMIDSLVHGRAFVRVSPEEVLEV
ncbi:MAG: hypothetical protein WA742_12495 [Candidatus Cybelea sp.]